MVAFMHLLAASSAVFIAGVQARRATEHERQKPAKTVTPNDLDRDEHEHTRILRQFYDHRYNFIPATRAETLWAVRVLQHAGLPNAVLARMWPQEWEIHQEPTMMDLLWYWIQMMTNNRYSGPPFSLSPPIVFEGDLRNAYPEELAWAVHAGHSFKNGHIGEACVYGMDCYINARLDPAEPTPGSGPQCEDVFMHERHRQVRASPLFQLRGRKEVNRTNEEHIKTLQRQESVLNKDAGIAPYENVPEEAINFFPRPILHGGKNFNQRSNKGGVDDVFFGAGAPFIAGASGSIEYLIHSMEDTLGGSVPEGLVPCSYLREALIGVMTAVLIAGGQHSLGECLAVAQELGYFNGIPSFIYQAPDGDDVSYEEVAAVFESYLSALGLHGSEGVLRELADSSKSID